MPWLRASSWPADLISPRSFLFQRDYVLGTSFDLTVWTHHEREAAMIESVVLTEIDRLSRILNRYDSESELSRLNAGSALSPASPDLITLLRAYEIWTARTGGASSGQLGGLVQLWKNAELTGITPSTADLASALENIHQPGWRIDSSTGQVQRLGHQALNVDSLGKGYILQKAVEAARTAFPGTWGIMLNIGGDMSVWGNGSALPDSPWRIFCANPHQPHDNAPPLTSIQLTRGSVATSAAYERGFTVAGKRFSHILDPRSGWPARGVASATAVARDSLTANALATALCVLTPQEGLTLLRTIEGAEALIIAADGTQFRSAGFGALESPVAQAAPVTDSTVPAPSLAPPATAPLTPSLAPPAAPSLAPLTPGLIVTILTTDQVSFVNGATHIKRPVQPDEKFRVMSVNGDDVTVVDEFGNAATLNRSSLAVVDTAPPPVATAATSTAPTSPANPGTPASTSATGSQWPAHFQVTLNLQIPPPPANAKRVERPYVALWVEDSNGKPIRTITVWGNGRWMKSLTNWWKFAAGQPDLISSTTRATRDAGNYQVVWDGLDDKGAPVPQGTYTIVLEVHREFGGHDTQRGKIDCESAAAQSTIPGATEFNDCPLAYGPPSS